MITTALSKEEQLKRCLDISCELFDFDKDIKSREVKVIDIKYPIITSAYKQFNGFVKGLEYIIADYFSVDRTNIYHAVNKIVGRVNSNLKYDDVYNFNVLIQSCNVLDAYEYKQLCTLNNCENDLYLYKELGSEIVVEKNIKKLILFKNKTAFLKYFKI